MTRRSILEYAQALRPRYLKASKEEKSKMLDEFIKNTGFHRKAAIRLLNRASRLTSGKRRGRKRKYGLEVAQALKQIWEATDRLCSKRLKPFMPEIPSLGFKYYPGDYLPILNILVPQVGQVP